MKSNKKITPKVVSTKPLETQTDTGRGPTGWGGMAIVGPGLSTPNNPKDYSKNKGG